MPRFAVLSSVTYQGSRLFPAQDETRLVVRHVRGWEEVMRAPLSSTQPASTQEYTMYEVPPTCPTKQIEEEGIVHAPFIGCAVTLSGYKTAESFIYPVTESQ